MSRIADVIFDHARRNAHVRAVRYSRPPGRHIRDRLPHRHYKLERTFQRAPLASLRFFREDSWRDVYAGELEVRPPGAPTTQTMAGPVARPGISKNRGRLNWSSALRLKSRRAVGPEYVRDPSSSVRSQREFARHRSSERQALVPENSPAKLITLRRSVRFRTSACTRRLRFGPQRRVTLPQNVPNPSCSPAV